MKKSDATKEKILIKALELFQKKGFEKSTMRTISQELDISLGLAYYYFPSKEDIVVEFYLQNQMQWKNRAEKIIQQNNDLIIILTKCLTLQFEILAPYRSFLNIIIKNAMNPESSLSPFSSKTSIIRQTNIEIFAQAMVKSRKNLPKESFNNFPYFIWLIQMALLLFWLYDKSKNQQNSFALVENIMEMLLIVLKLPSIGPNKALQKILNNIMIDISGLGRESNLL